MSAGSVISFFLKREKFKTWEMYVTRRCTHLISVSWTVFNSKITLDYFTYYFVIYRLVRENGTRAVGDQTFRTNCLLALPMKVHHSVRKWLLFAASCMHCILVIIRYQLQTYLLKNISDFSHFSMANI